MVATPYVLLAAFGFMIHRGFKKIRQAEAARGTFSGDEPPETETGIHPDLSTVPHPRG
jgi:hypothetical protein